MPIKLFAKHSALALAVLPIISACGASGLEPTGEAANTAGSELVTHSDESSAADPLMGQALEVHRDPG